MARKTNFVASNNKEYYRTSLHLGYDVEGKKLQKVFYGKTRKEALEKKQTFIDSSANGTVLTKSDVLGNVMYSLLFDIVILEVKPKSFARYEGFIGTMSKTQTSPINSKVYAKNLQTFFNNVFSNFYN